MTVTLRIEIFPADLDATADFYTQVLGFTLVRDQRDGSPGYLALERDRVRIGAAYRDEPERQPGRRPPSGTEIVIEVDDLDAARARLALATPEPVETGWGARLFQVQDPDGTPVWFLKWATTVA